MGAVYATRHYHRRVIEDGDGTIRHYYIQDTGKTMGLKPVMKGQRLYIVLFVNVITQLDRNSRITQGKYGIRS